VEDDGLPGGSRFLALTEPVSWPGPKWAGLLGRGGGLHDQVSFSLLFDSFSFYSIFSFEFQF
jgi:hypothetical protein